MPLERCLSAVAVSNLEWMVEVGGECEDLEVGHDIAEGDVLGAHVQQV